MPRLVVDPSSLKATIRALEAKRKQVQSAKTLAVRVAGGVLRDLVKLNVSVPPIGGSPESHRRALAAQDHPYARRHGQITFRPQGGYPGSSRESLVHTVGRGNTLRNAIRGRFITSPPSYEISIDTARAPHAIFVIRGTSVMLPRDVIRVITEDPAVRRQLRGLIRNTMAIVFRQRPVAEAP